MNDGYSGHSGGVIKNLRKFWIGLFALWGLMLTGVVGHFNSEWGGKLECLGLWVRAPGWIQWEKLQELQATRRTKLGELETRISRLEERATELKEDPEAQKEAIRRVLGYIARDEYLVMIANKK